jgi:predicted dehydrogenase
MQEIFLKTGSGYKKTLIIHVKCAINTGFNKCKLKKHQYFACSHIILGCIFTQKQIMIKTGIYGFPDSELDILEKIMDVPELNIVGMYNPLVSNDFREVESKYNLKAYPEAGSLISDVDAIIALSPMSGLDKVEELVRNSKHVFFEPSAEYCNRDVSKLSGIVEEANVKVQAGFHHRFNNTFLSARPFIVNPKFIQANYFKRFSFNTEACSVLMDMLIGDIDIVLGMIRSNLKAVHANATSINREGPDIINVRLEFMNGAVAQLTAGRIATNNTHEISFYCDRDYTSIDLIRNKAWQVKKRNQNSEMKLFQENIGDLIVDPIPVKPNNHYYDEFSSFAKSIVFDKSPEVDLETVLKTYSVAAQIKDKIKLSVG